ncbi:hypothetical protein LTR53_017247 [Teratosphaeriaceae sp. CCFEE 6253]|nr:hypothetical protein LTR53_017247 [Teratosphaeriaceae sp. CCFEE 6253]
MSKTELAAMPSKERRAVAPRTVVKQESTATDRFYLLESHKKWRRNFHGADGIKYTSCPIIAREVEKGTWTTAHSVHEKCKASDLYSILSRQVHGRRMNDEVELFQNEDGEETAGIREEMETLGLTVRSYIEGPTKSKLPPRKFTVSQEKTYAARCVEALKKAIAQHELDTDRPTPYALLADAGGGDTKKGARSSKTLLVIILPEMEFKDFFEQDYEYFTSNECRYKVFGTYHDDKVKWHCGDAEFTAFFHSPSAEVVIRVFDGIERQQTRQRELDKKAKRGAQKMKRQLRIAAGEPGNADSVLEQDDGEGNDAEARVEAKKARERVKRKAQQARRKASRAAAEAAEEAASEGTEGAEETVKCRSFLTMANLKLTREALGLLNLRRASSDDDTDATPRVFGPGGDFTGPEQRRRVVEDISSSAESSPGLGSSESGSSDVQEREINVIQVSADASPADITRLVEQTAGRVYVAHAE